MESEKPQVEELKQSDFLEQLFPKTPPEPPKPDLKIIQENIEDRRKDHAP